MKLSVPFVYSAYGRFAPDRNYVHRFFLGKTEVDVGTIDGLPAPEYVIADPADPDDFLEWFDIDGVLMRVVMRGRVPASIREIEDADQLVPPRRGSWFHDHPSAHFLMPKGRAGRHYYRLQADDGRFVVSRSNRTVREEATKAEYAECLVWNKDWLLAPRPAPTWKLTVLPRWIAIEPDYRRWSPGVLPAFHFGIAELEHARAFAAEVAPGREIFVQPAEWRHPGFSGTDGTLRTAASFAAKFVRRFSRAPLYTLSADQIRALGALGETYTSGGTDADADTALNYLAAAKWPTAPSVHKELVNHIPIRRRFVFDANFDPELTDFLSADIGRKT